MFFYELHEGDNEVYSDVLVVSESEWEPEEFFELVQTHPPPDPGQYHHDTLIEAIADELERDHGFIYVSDDRLAAAVNVSVDRGRELPRPSSRSTSPTRPRMTMTTTMTTTTTTDERVDFKSVLVDFDPATRPPATDRYLLKRISSTSPSWTR